MFRYLHILAPVQHGFNVLRLVENTEQTKFRVAQANNTQLAISLPQDQVSTVVVRAASVRRCA